MYHSLFLLKTVSKTQLIRQRKFNNKTLSEANASLFYMVPFRGILTSLRSSE